MSSNGGVDGWMSVSNTVMLTDYHSQKHVYFENSYGTYFFQILKNNYKKFKNKKNKCLVGFANFY
jgi:hypothetical protein